MSQTLTISDELYARLQEVTRQQGLSSIEELLETWHTGNDPIRRQEIVRRIDSLRERLFSVYGEMPDSAPLLRQDRTR